MEIKIGIQNTAKEIIINSAINSIEEIRNLIFKTCNDHESKLLELTDIKEKIVIIPIEKIAYIEVDKFPQNTIGFGIS